MTELAFAKVNLTLEVLGKRSDGYHALRSVVLPVSLADEISVAPAAILASDAGYADDLCLKAARALRDAAGEPSRGASIRVVKRIPVGGGLGGGSADAAATLRALNALWGLGLTRESLAAIGARVGSDVPALVLGGPILMEGRGETVSRLAPLARPLHLVLANPGVFCSTAEVYARCQSRSPAAPNATAAMVAALRTGDFEAIAAALANDLQPPAVRLHPEIARALDVLRRAGACAALMSGSGSTVFALCPSADAAETLVLAVRNEGLSAWAVRTSPENMV